MFTFESPLPDLASASVLITGGTGSFGQSLARRLLADVNVRRVVIFSRDELKQYEMQQAFTPEQLRRLRFFIGDVRDVARLEMAMREVDYVVHAAALKHVTAAEYNPFECVRTNINGAENVVTAALRTRVKKVVALSTDKACNPINLYGATKLASDKIFVAANSLAGSQPTRFCVVRYGNVVASRGSVIPFFRKLIAGGAKELPITDERMTRFWITLPQGVAFVLSSLAMMRGGEIFVPKIPSMRMPDLATALAPTLARRTVGIRPGEKLHEVMISEDDSRQTFELPDRYVIAPAMHPWSGENLRIAHGTPVQDGFRYASDSNTEWLDVPAMRNLLARLDVTAPAKE
jgi:UDP-N-acetylglucosamine 4,6-dehydratase